MKKLGIIARKLEEDSIFGTLTYYLEDMVRFSTHLEVATVVFSPFDWHPESATIRSFTFDGTKWFEEQSPIPKLIYNRFSPLTPSEWELYQKMVSHLEACGHEFCNPPQLESVLKDKRRFQTFLEQNKLPVIPLHNDYSLETILGTLEVFQTIYVKPFAGSGGHGISLLSLEGDQLTIQSEVGKRLVAPKDLSQELMAMFPPDEYILQPMARIGRYRGACYDIRSMIQNNGLNQYEISAISVRLGQKGRWVSNLNSGGNGLAIEELEDHFKSVFNTSLHEVVREVKRLSRMTAKLLTAKYGDFAEIALDMLLTQDRGLIILEGNSKPSRWVFNTIAEQYESGTVLHSKYRALREKTVVYPMLFASNKLR